MNVIYSQKEVMDHYNYVNSRSGMLSSSNLALNTGDFSNHNDVSPTIELSYQDNDYVYWTATAPLPPGTELTSDYVIDSNTRALLAYGFVIDDPLKDVANLIIKEPNMPTPIVIPLSFLESSRLHVMSVLRVLVANQAEQVAMEATHSSGLKHAVTIPL